MTVPHKSPLAMHQPESSGLWTRTRESSQMDDLRFGGYVESHFVPKHVLQKTAAGQTHYCAMLKHILTPDLVNRIFGMGPKRLLTVPGQPYLDDVRLPALKQEHVEDVLSWVSHHGYSNVTVHHIKCVIRVVVQHATAAGLFSGPNPASAISSPRVVFRTKDYNLTAEKLRIILRMLPSPEREIAMLIITTGISIQEACSLTWNRVNFGHNTLLVDGEVVPPRAMLIRRQDTFDTGGSNGVARIRTEKIPDATMETLVRLRPEPNETVDTESFMFLLRGTEEPLPVENASLTLKTIGQTLGLSRLSWQMLRRKYQELISEFRNQLATKLSGE